MTDTLQLNGSNAPVNRGKFSLPVRCGLYLIRLYQRFLSPVLGSQCRFTPTCSRYTYTAIEKYGLIKGSLMGAWRICRCNPFSKGGYDPVL